MDFMDNNSDQDDMAPQKSRLAAAPVIDFSGNHTDQLNSFFVRTFQKQLFVIICPWNLRQFKSLRNLL